MARLPRDPPNPTKGSHLLQIDPCSEGDTIREGFLKEEPPLLALQVEHVWAGRGELSVSGKAMCELSLFCVWRWGLSRPDALPVSGMVHLIDLL